MTLNLENLETGFKESVRIESQWPAYIPPRLLGFCSSKPQIKNADLEKYLESRIIDFRMWASGNKKILNDLDYFLKKWDEN